MKTLLVVEPEVLRNAGARFSYRCIVFQVHLLVFERSPQPLDKDVVHTAPPAVHADGDLPRRQLAGELLAGELRTLVAVKDVRPSPAQRRLRSFAAGVER